MELPLLFFLALIAVIALGWRYFGPLRTTDFAVASDGIFLLGIGTKISWEQITDAKIAYDAENSEPHVVIHVKNGHELRLRQYPRWLRLVAETFHPEKSDEIVISPERLGIDPKTLVTDIKVQIALARGGRP